jgi:hypothetical protein
MENDFHGEVEILSHPTYLILGEKNQTKRKADTLLNFGLAWLATKRYSAAQCPYSSAGRATDL